MHSVVGWSFRVYVFCVCVCRSVEFPCVSFPPYIHTPTQPHHTTILTQNQQLFYRTHYTVHPNHNPAGPPKKKKPRPTTESGSEGEGEEEGDGGSVKGNGLGNGHGNGNGHHHPPPAQQKGMNGHGANGANGHGHAHVGGGGGGVVIGPQLPPGMARPPAPAATTDEEGGVVGNGGRKRWVGGLYGVPWLCVINLYPPTRQPTDPTMRRGLTRPHPKHKTTHRPLPSTSTSPPSTSPPASSPALSLTDLEHRIHALLRRDAVALARRERAVAAVEGTLCYCFVVRFGCVIGGGSMDRLTDGSPSDIHAPSTHTHTKQSA